MTRKLRPLRSMISTRCAPTAPGSSAGPTHIAAFIAPGQFDRDKTRLPDQWLAIVPQITAPLINMLPATAVPTNHIRDKRAVGRGFRDDPQFLRVGPSAPAFNSGQNLLPHKSPRSRL